MTPEIKQLLEDLVKLGPIAYTCPGCARFVGSTRIDCKLDIEFLHPPNCVLLRAKQILDKLC